MGLVLGTVLTFLAIWLLPGLYEWCRRAWMFRKLPRPANSHWFYGVTRGMNNPHKIHRLNLEWSRSQGPLVAFRVLYLQGIVIYDPIMIHKITSREMQATKPHHYRVLTKITSAKGCRNLVSMDTHDEEWKLARKGLAPAFAQKNIKQAFTVVRTIALKLCDELKRQGSSKYIDVDTMAMRETIDIITLFGFGVELGCIEGRNTLNEGTDFMQDMHLCMAELSRQNMIPFRRHVYKFLPGGKAIDQRFQQIYTLYDKLLDAAQKLAAQGKLDEQSIAAHLFRLRDSQGTKLSRDQLASQAGVFLLAGHDTTGHTIAYTLYFLSQNPDVEAKLVAELDAHGLLQTPARPNPRQLEYEDLGKLTYLQAVVRESMRLLPVVTAVGRMFLHDVKIEGYVIPRKTPVICSMYPGYINCWEDGTEFRPERWLEPAAEAYSVEKHNMAKVLGEQYTASELPVGVSRNSDGTLEAHYSSKLLNGSSVKSLNGTSTKSLNGSVFSSNASMDVDPLSPRSSAGPKRHTPFSEGPRDCVGQSLAKVSVPTTVATLVSQFTFALDPTFNKDSIDYVAVTLRPNEGVPMRCIPRVQQ